MTTTKITKLASKKAANTKYGAIVVAAAILLTAAVSSGVLAQGKMGPFSGAYGAHNRGGFGEMMTHGTYGFNTS
jgi:hypothetical protein